MDALRLSVVLRKTFEEAEVIIRTVAVSESTHTAL